MISQFSFGGKAKVVYFFLIAGLVPLISLQTIFNATLFDFFNVAFILFFLTYLFLKGKLQIPLLIPIAIIFIGSLISMFNAQVPLNNSAALIIDLYLFIFFIVLYNVIETKRELKIFISLWIIFAALQGGLMIGDILMGSSRRALGTFLNPNMGASYIGISFFLIFQPYTKKRNFLTLFFGILILGGLLATKSLAGLVAFLFGALAVIYIYWYRAKAFNKIKLISVLLIIAVVGIIIFPEFTKIPNFLGRFPKSTYGKSNLWQAGFDIFIKNPLGHGIGPAGFKEVGPKIKGPIYKRKELHSDWLAFLVERGVIGFLGLVLLFGALTMMLWRTLKSENSEREYLWIIGLSGMFIFTLSFSFAHEILHFRHVWCLFVLIAVQYKFRKKKGEERQLASNH